MKIGILVPTTFAHPGEYLADARALEAAGADCLWVAASGETGADAITIVAALAAVTGRIELGVVTRSAAEAQELAEDPRLRTLQRLARDRVTIAVAADGGIVEAGVRWVRVAVPADRAAWQATLETAGREGAAAVLVEADARLIDLLRHPVEEGDRGDILISTG